jgi:DNA transposition AAA+ family ATPase
MDLLSIDLENASNEDIDYGAIGELIREFISDFEIESANELVRITGVSSTVINQLMHGKYPVPQKFGGKVKDLLFYMQTEWRKLRGSYFIQTRQSECIEMTIKDAMKNNTIGLIYGASGTGKTTTCKMVCESIKNGIYVECDSAMTSGDLLDELCDKLRIDRQKTLSKTMRAIASEVKRANKVIFIDEAEYLKHRTLELIRRINDLSEIALIIIGATNAGRYDILKSMENHPQIKRRMRKYWAVEKIKDTEVEEMVRYYYREYDKNVVGYINKIAKGNISILETLLKNAVDIGENNDKYKVLNSELVNLSSAMTPMLES